MTIQASFMFQHSGYMAIGDRARGWGMTITNVVPNLALRVPKGVSSRIDCPSARLIVEWRVGG